MSQNRQEAKDRERAESDYRINLKSELIIDDLHRKLEEVLEIQRKLSKQIDELSSSRVCDKCADDNANPSANKSEKKVQ